MHLSVVALSEISFFGKFHVELPREALLFILEPGLLVSAFQQVEVCVLIVLTRESEVVLCDIGMLLKVVRSLGHLAEVVVGGLDPLLRVVVLALLDRVNFPKAVHFQLISLSLLLELLELELTNLDLLTSCVTVVRLLLHVALTRKNLSLTAGDLLPDRCDLTLAIVVGSALFIHVVPGVITFFFQSLHGDRIRVVSRFKIVVLEHLLVLKVSEFGLNRVQLVPQGEVVFVALLDLENFSFEL